MLNHILIIDDDLKLTDLIKTYLQNHQFKVTFAAGYDDLGKSPTFYTMQASDGAYATPNPTCSRGRIFDQRFSNSIWLGKTTGYVLVDVATAVGSAKDVDINGGSFSITVAKKKSKFKEYSKIVNWLLEREKILDYNSPSTHLSFYKNVKKHKKLLKDLISNLKDMKKKVIGYGASTKGNVILQYCNINKKDLSYIVDVNKYKKNKYTPGSLIKITDEKVIKKYSPDYMLVLPWHFKNFILQKEKKYLNNGGKMIFPLPDIEIV